MANLDGAVRDHEAVSGSIPADSSSAGDGEALLLLRVYFIHLVDNRTYVQLDKSTGVL